MNKKRLTLCIISIAILAVSLTVMLCDYLIPLSFWTHPILNFLFALFVGFGIMSLVLGVTNKSPWYIFTATGLLGLAIIYVLLQYIEWWIGVIFVVVVCAVMAIISVMRSGVKTEDIALNESPEYKNYKQRCAEKNSEEKSEREEIPQLKSFKD